MNDALVSVVMPAFDEEKFIGEALASVLAQTYRPIEVIVVDDGSSDRTAELAAAYEVSVLRRRHQGPAAARNAGLSAGTGVYWTICDADDVVPRDRLAQQVAHLEQHPEHAIVLGLTEAFVTPGEPRPDHYNPVWDEGPYTGHPATVLARRTVLESVGQFDETLWLGEDIDWLARARAAGIGFGLVDSVVLRYRVHGANTSSDPRANQKAMLRAVRASVRRRRELRSS